MLTILAAIGASGWGAVTDIKGEISDNRDAIEEVDEAHMRQIDAVEFRLEQVKNDARIARCILVAQVEQREPLGCIDRPVTRDERFEFSDE